MDLIEFLGFLYEVSDNNRILSEQKTLIKFLFMIFSVYSESSFTIIQKFLSQLFKVFHSCISFALDARLPKSILAGEVMFMLELDSLNIRLKSSDFMFESFHISNQSHTVSF